MSYISDSLSDLFNMIVAPRLAYASIARRPIVWFPLLLLVVAWIVVWNWYYAAVDFPWLINHLIADATAHAPPEAHDAIAKGMSGIKPGALIVISSVTVVVIFLALSTIVCLYLQIVSAILNDSYTLKQWFAFSIWSSIPSLVGIVAMVVNFFLAEGHRIGPEQLNPLTLNNLFFHVGSLSPFKRLLDSVDLTLFWSWALMIFGYRQWTGRSAGRSTLVILAPLMVIYGVWIFVSAFG